MSWKTLIILNLLPVFGVVIHRQGPTHKKMAIGCIEEIIDKHFHLTYRQSDKHHILLFSVVISENLTSPAFEIQEVVLKKIHSLAKSYLVETLSSKKRLEFESFTDCSEGEDDDGCMNNFVIDFKSNFCMIIVDNVLNFDRSLEILQGSNTFSTEALYLVFIESELEDYEHVAKSILEKMWDISLIRTAVLVPVTLQSFYLYRLKQTTRGPYPCGSNITLKMLDKCEKGHMKNIDQKYYSGRTIINYYNCSMGVISTPYDPFVIDENTGFEIDVLRSVAQTLNINFNVTLTSEDQTYNWGHKENGSWTGKLKLVYEQNYIGIGNIDYGMPEAKDDFSFSRYYHMADLVFVVPIAEYVPKWRVLVAIFSVEMWGVCFGIIVGFAVCFYLTSKLGREVSSYRLLGESFLSSFQITVSQAVFQHPISDITRVFFLSMSIWSIIIASAYTCSLVYYLTNPIREHQPTTIEDFRDSFRNMKYEMGGISRYRELFNSPDKEAQQVFKIYQTVSGVNNTAAYWIGLVGERRNIWTISSKLYANHFVSKAHSVASYPNGKPKVFVFNEKLMSYSICMLTRKGGRVLRSINHVLKKLVWGGIVAHICDKYRHSLRRKAESEENKPLTVDHLQGAFALLVLGYLFGAIIFVGEWVVKKTRKRKGVVRRGEIMAAKKRR